MHISLPAKMESIINAKVESGLYSSVSEVMREAVRVWIKHNERELQLDNIRRAVATGVEQLDGGQSEVFDENTLRDIEAGKI